MPCSSVSIVDFEQVNNCRLEAKIWGEKFTKVTYFAGIEMVEYLNKFILVVL